ncbi:MAG: hypothetical protein JXA79_06650 [Deltaproteobacteria bacterium]|nr:hypothetical protein [Deltaproteobacteria bacterium]
MGYRLKRFLSDDVDHWPLGPEKKLFTTEPQSSQSIYLSCPSAFLTMGKTQAALKGTHREGEGKSLFRYGTILLGFVSIMHLCFLFFTEVSRPVYLLLQSDERKVVKSFSNRILTVICTP